MTRTLTSLRTLFGRKTIASAALAAGAIGGSVAMTSPASAATANWDAIAAHESSGNWSTNTGNGYGGGLQISPTTSAAFGGPSSAAGIAAMSKGQQIALAQKILDAQGPGAWPNTYVSGGSGSTGHTATATRVTHSTPVTHHTVSGPAAHPTVQRATVQHATVKHTAVQPTGAKPATVTHVAQPAAAKVTTVNKDAAVHEATGLTRATSQRPLFTTALAGTYRTDVAAWQATMAHLGYTISVDGHYGKQSATVALAFQKAHNLLVDGIVGPQTWGATFR